MPIYEYQCDACGHHLEALRKISDKPLKKCPECGKPRLKRLLSAPMFLLKGSGWYETDFKSDKETKRNLADRPDKEEPKAEPTATTQSDAKPDAKVDAKPDAKVDAKPEAKAETKAETKAEAKADSAKKSAKPRGLRKAKRRRA